MRRLARSAVARRPRTVSACLAAALACAAALPALAGERIEPLPKQLEDVDVVERLDEQVPLDATFTDQAGRPVTLGELLGGDRPVILTLGYYRCPMLCNLVLNGLIESMRELSWTAGDEFRVVTVSINPEDTPGLAANKRQAYLAAYGRRPADEGWHFLTGRPASIRALADAVGFRYKALPDGREFAHPAVVMLLTPDGRVSRYLYGVKYDPATLRLSLVEASDGRIGTTIDRVLLFCFHYDAVAGAYAPAAMNLMRAAAAVTVVALGLLLALLWRRDLSRSRATAAGSVS